MRTRAEREKERFISSHDIGSIFSYKLRYFRQTCGAYMVNTDLLPAAPQIGILSSFFLVELPDSKSQLMEQIVLSIMVFCLGGSHQSLKIFCFNLKKVLKIKKKDQVRLKEVSDWHWEQREPSQAFQKETEPSLHHQLNHHHQNQNLKAKMEAKQVTQPEERGWAQRLHFVCIFADGFWFEGALS